MRSTVPASVALWLFRENNVDVDASVCDYLLTLIRTGDPLVEIGETDVDLV